MAIERSVRINVETGNARRELNTLSGSLRSADGATNLLRNSLAGLAAGFSLSAVVNQITSFEDQMAGVRAVSGATADEFARLSAQARELGATTTFGAEQAAGAQRFLAQAGFEVNEILSSTPGILNLARAGQLELAEAADIASNVLSGMGLEVSNLNNLNDVLAATANRSNTNIQQLGQALSFASSFARNASISMQETSAAIGVLGDSGVQSTRAGTGLVGVIRQLSTFTPQAESALRKYGVATSDVDISTVGLQRALRTLRDANISSSDSFTIFGTEAANSANILINSVDRLGEFTEELNNVEGEASRVAGIMGDTLSASIRGFTSAVSEAVLQSGDSGLTGVMRELLTVATGVVQSFNGLSDEFAVANNLSERQQSTIEAATVAVEALALAYTSRLVGGLAASTAALARQSAAQLTANTAARSSVGLLGVQVRALNQTTVAANAMAIATRAGGTALAALGGPVGIAITAAAGIAYYVSTLESADEKQRKANQSAIEYLGTLSNVSVLKFAAEVEAAADNYDTARSKLNAYKLSLESTFEGGAEQARQLSSAVRNQLAELENNEAVAKDALRAAESGFNDAAKAAKEYNRSLSGQGDGGTGGVIDQASAYLKLKGQLDAVQRIQNQYNQTVAEINEALPEGTQRTELLTLAERKRDEALASLNAKIEKSRTNNEKLRKSYADLLGQFDPAVAIANRYAETMDDINKSTATDVEKQILRKAAQKQLNEELNAGVKTTKEFLAQYNPLIAAEIERDSKLKELSDSQGTANEKAEAAIVINKQYAESLDEIQRQATLNLPTEDTFFGALAQGISDSTITAKDSFDQIREVGTTAISGLSSALAGYIATGEGSFADFARNIIQRLLAIETRALLTQAAMSFLGLGLAQNVSSVAGAAGYATSGYAGAFGFARGGVVDNKYASGGMPSLGAYSNSVVSTPTKFAMGDGVGQMGEAGAEAILPLQRTAGGELGVKADVTSGQQAQSAPQVNVPVSIVNVAESPEDYISSSPGTKQIINIMRANRNVLR